MYRRLLLPLMSAAAAIVLVLVVLPTNATGAERTGRDTYVFGENLVLDTPVGGSVQVYSGEVTVSSVIHGDLLVFGGSVEFTGEGRVEGNLIYAASRVTGAEGRVSGNIYPLASLEGAAVSMSKNAIVAVLLFGWMLVAVAVTLMGGREIRTSSVEVRTSALHCFVLGLVALTSFVLTAIAFSYLVPYLIGIPLLAALGVFAILTKIYGMIAVFHAVGTLVAGLRRREQLTSRKWLRGDLAMVVVGLLLLGTIRMIPVVGTVVWGLASVFGVGVALATRFGRREPWFLAWRAAEA
jgi:cytoskeletal protein CcmA (bactofilin family)